MVYVYLYVILHTVSRHPHQLIRWRPLTAGLHCDYYSILWLDIFVCVKEIVLTVPSPTGVTTNTIII